MARPIPCVVPVILLAPTPRDAVADGRKDDLHHKLRQGSRQRAGGALQGRPTESVPEDRCKTDENKDRKDKVVQKLPDKGGHVGAHGVGQLAVGIPLEQSADGKIQEVIDHRRAKKGHRTAQQNKPGAAKNAVKGLVISRARRDRRRHEKDEAGQKIDRRRQHRDAIGRARAEVLGDYVHAHKR